MRLYKKAAVCLLAAAMALSMLTACGGSDNSTGGGNNPGSNPGGGSSTTEPAPKPEEIVLPGDGDENDPGTVKVAIVPSMSKMAKYNNKIAGATEYYVAETSASYDANEKLTSEVAIVLARKNGNTYMKQSGKVNGKSTTLEIVFEKTDRNTYAEYMMFSTDQVALKMDEVTENEMGSLDLVGTQLPSQIWSTKVKVGSVTYDAETYTESGAEHTICYAQDGSMKYEFIKQPNGAFTSIAMSAMRVGVGSSQNLCKIPAGYKTYEVGVNSQGNSVLVDASGNTYKVDAVRNTNGKVISFTVKDANGTDVSQNFEWLKKLVDIVN